MKHFKVSTMQKENDFSQWDFGETVVISTFLFRLMNHKQYKQEIKNLYEFNGLYFVA